jgi:polar amino acid transport system ATP-binding protein
VVAVSIGDEVQVLALIGPSGGGKSTFLRLIGGLESPTSGEVMVNGIKLPVGDSALREWRKKNGFLFQSFNLFPHLTAEENVILPLVEVHQSSREDAKNRAQEMLSRFGLAKHLGKQPGQLSGGQQQRVALARAIAHKPQWLLLDEPTSALDPEMKAEVLDLIEELQKSGQKIILSTHEMGFARRASDHVIFLSDGQNLEEGNAEELFENPKTAEVKLFLEKVMKW